MYIPEKLKDDKKQVESYVKNIGISFEFMNRCKGTLYRFLILNSGAMICKSYDQLTIVEKTQFIGKLMHLVQTNDNAFMTADQLLSSADKEGIFKNVVILPAREHLDEHLEEYVETPSYHYHDQESMFIPSHNVVVNIFNKTRDSIHRSYQKLFAKLAS